MIHIQYWLKANIFKITTWMEMHASKILYCKVQAHTNKDNATRIEDLHGLKVKYPCPFSKGKFTLHFCKFYSFWEKLVNTAAEHYNTYIVQQIKQVVCTFFSIIRSPHVCDDFMIIFWQKYLREGGLVLKSKLPTYRGIAA